MTSHSSTQLSASKVSPVMRRDSHPVRIGDLMIGSNHPILIQSMTTTDTMDTEATVRQILSLHRCGCACVRLTVPNVPAAKHLEVIKKRLIAQACTVPLVADVHFSPAAAEIAARWVEKVRINPGNYVDSKRFTQIATDPATYAQALDKLRKKLSTLIAICKTYGTALRIGTNHGSLSDRIMTKYGDTALGMVESALECVRVCEDENFDAIVLSMKASQPKVMVHAYRLLVQRLLAGRHLPYALHLGVTEAGNGLEGRMKSAVGIGTLLAQGLGDTIRVSLTEAPEKEIPVAQALIQHITPSLPLHPELSTEYNYTRYPTHQVAQIGNNIPPAVVIEPATPMPLKELMPAVGREPRAPHAPTQETACDIILRTEDPPTLCCPDSLSPLNSLNSLDPLVPAIAYAPNPANTDWLRQVPPHKPCLVVIDPKNPVPWALLSARKQLGLVIDVHHLGAAHTLIQTIRNQGHTHPIVLRWTRSCPKEILPLLLGTHMGALLLDGHGDAVWVCHDANTANTNAFALLQATRLRITQTEFIACPSCGRTLFDLEETTQNIRDATVHLKGLKIAIMGCIVNGPGEMADADYGYVGAGKGRITLYRGKEIVQRGIPDTQAVQALIELIQRDNKWIDPPT